MKRNEVSSSNIASIGYDSDSETLEIEFKGGGVYRYEGVPKEVYAKLMDASSKGKYFHAYIRDIYKTVQV